MGEYPAMPLRVTKKGPKSEPQCDVDMTQRDINLVSFLVL